MQGLIALAIAILILALAGAIKFLFTTVEDNSIFWASIAIFLLLYIVAVVVISWMSDVPGTSDIPALVDFTSSLAHDVLIMDGQ